nr:MAG TPA: hypothetical protein [Caudoviricetes sp.]
MTDKYKLFGKFFKKLFLNARNIEKSLYFCSS